MIILDASALIEVLLQTKAARGVERHIFSPGETVHAPHLIDIEVTQVLRRYWLAREITEERGRFALADLADFPMRRYPHDFTVSRIWALRANLSAYDAAYVALAEALNGHLLTRDSKLSRAKGHNATVVLV